MECIYHKEYHKQDKHKIAFNNIARGLDILIFNIKAKMNSPQAQLGREVTKVNKTRSGHSTGELYTRAPGFY